MLQTIRDRFTGKFAIAILALICVPFVFFGINYDFIGQGYAARVNGEEIPAVVLENAYRNELLRYADQGVDIPVELRQLIREGVLDSLIQDMLVDLYLEENGYRISDQLVTDFIQRAPEFRVDGKFAKEAYYQWLSERAIDATQFEQSQRRSLRQSQLQRAVGATAFVTPSEYRRYLNLFAEQRQVTYAEIDVASLVDTIEVTDDEVAAYYDARPESFMAPESVDLQYVEIRRDEIGSSLALTDEEVQRYYEESSSRYLQEEQRRARHILIPFGDDEAAAEQEATALTERVKAGEPFEDLARQYSKDGGTAEQGGDLGLLLKSQLPGRLGDAVFGMNQGDIEGPVRTNFGFHVVRLDAVQPGGPLSLAEVRGELERELREQKVDDAYVELERALSDALFDASDMQSMAAQIGVELKTASGYTRAGGEPFGSNQAAIDAIFDERMLNERRISDIIELDANRTVVLQVTDYRDASRIPLDDVREQIVSAIRSESAATLAADRAAELEAALRAGTDLRTAAEGMEGVVVTDRVFGRQDEDMDPMVGAAIFQEKKPLQGRPRIGNVITQDGNYAVYNLMAYAPGRPESIPLAERDAGKLRLGAQSGNADFVAFVAELERRAEIVKSEDVLAQQSMFE